MKVLFLGFGFCANGLWHYWREQKKLTSVDLWGTHRDDDKKKLLLEKNITPLLMGEQSITDAMDAASAWVVSASPAGAAGAGAATDNGGDPFFASYGAVIKKIGATKNIIYLSTTGVYGDHGGDWVDEGSPCHPSHQRSKKRLLAEQQWRGVGAAVLRLGGIYGPVLDGMGQNTLQSIINGTARRIEKPGQVFGRIHVFDIASAMAMLIEKNIHDEVFNLVDDEPTNPRVVVDYGYELLQKPLPPLEHFDDVKDTMSPMAQSFFQDNKRVKNDKIKKLGWRPIYPSYREGLQMIKKTMEQA